MTDVLALDAALRKTLLARRDAIIEALVTLDRAAEGRLLIADEAAEWARLTKAVENIEAILRG